MNSANLNPANSVEQWSYQDLCSFFQLIHHSTHLRPSQVREVNSMIGTLANANTSQYLPPTQSFSVGGQMPYLPVSFQPFNLPQNDPVLIAFTPNFSVGAPNGFAMNSNLFALGDPYGTNFGQQRQYATEPIDPSIASYIQQQSDANNNIGISNLFAGAGINLQTFNNANVVSNNRENGNTQTTTPGIEQRIPFGINGLLQNPGGDFLAANRNDNPNIDVETVDGDVQEGLVELAIDESDIAERISISNEHMEHLNSFGVPPKKSKKSSKRELAIRRAKVRKEKREQELRNRIVSHATTGSVQCTRAGRQVRPTKRYSNESNVKLAKNRPLKR